jgi:hypothetical protein
MTEPEKQAAEIKTLAIASLRSWLGTTDGWNDADLMLPLRRDEVREIVAEHADLEAAANAVLAQSVFVYGTAGDPWCAQCGRSLSADGHSETCTLGALAALLDGDA